MAENDGIVNRLATLALICLCAGVIYMSWQKGGREPCPSACPRKTGGSMPSIVFITVDTLRADALGCYGTPGSPASRPPGLAEGSGTARREGLTALIAPIRVRGVQLEPDEDGEDAD